MLVVLAHGFRATIFASVVFVVLMQLTNDTPENFPADLLKDLEAAIFMTFVVVPFAYVIALPGLLLLALPVFWYAQRTDKLFDPFSLSLLGSFLAALYYYLGFGFKPETPYLVAFAVGGFLTGYFVWTALRYDQRS